MKDRLEALYWIAISIIVVAVIQLTMSLVNEQTVDLFGTYFIIMGILILMQSKKIRGDMNRNDYN